MDGLNQLITDTLTTSGRKFEKFVYIQEKNMVEATEGRRVTTQGAEANMMRIDRSWFIQSRTGNIKD